MGLLMGVIAFILEKIVMRSVRREGGGTPSAGGMTVTTKGGEIDVDDLLALADDVDHDTRVSSPPMMPNVTGIQGATRSDNAVKPLANTAATAIRPRVNRRPARRIVSSSEAARKFTSSF